MRSKYALLTLLIALIASNIASAAETQDIAFKAKCDGTEQRYIAIFPDGFDAKKPVDLLVALHGHGSDRWQYAKVERGSCIAARQFAAKTQDALRLPRLFAPKTSWMGPKAEADVLQIIKDVQDKYTHSPYVPLWRFDGRQFHAQLCRDASGLARTASPPSTERPIIWNTRNSSRTSPNRSAARKRRFRKSTRNAAPNTGPSVSRCRSPSRSAAKTPSSPPTASAASPRFSRSSAAPSSSIDRPDMGHSSDPADATKALEFMLEESAK